METNNNWKLGTALETHIQLLQKLGADGVEAELKRIREATFERMRNHKNNSISWERICRFLAQRALENDQKTNEPKPPKLPSDGYQMPVQRF